MYIPKEILLKLLPVVTSQIERMPHELVELTKEISRQNTGSINWPLSASYAMIKYKKKGMREIKNQMSRT